MLGEGRKSLDLRLEVNLLDYGAESEGHFPTQHKQSPVLNKEKVTPGRSFAPQRGEKEAEDSEAGTYNGRLTTLHSSDAPQEYKTFCSTDFRFPKCDSGYISVHTAMSFSQETPMSDQDSRSQGN